MEYYSGPMQLIPCKQCGEVMSKHVVITGGHILCPDDWMMLHPDPQTNKQERENHEIP